MKFKTLAIALAALMAVGCAAPKDQVLVLTERGGLHGPFTDRGLEWLAQLGEQNNFTITELNDARVINKEYLKQFKAVVQLDYPTFKWSPEGQEAMQEYVEKGLGGWVGFHHASLIGEFDGYPMWQWVSDFMGGIVYSNYIEELISGTVYVEDKTHPVMKGVSDSFFVPDDEFYIYDKSCRLGGIRVLAHVDEDSYDHETNIKMGDHPVVWTNEKVAGRNVYIQFGHSPKLYDSKDFTTMFTNAVLWALGR